MERIEILISKLNEQFQQKADSSELLATVQLLQFELTKMKAGSSQSLGTAKVAVVLPIANVVAVAAGYEKYAPRPVAEKPMQEVRETILVDKGSLSVVQKNSQLDMVFDPMTEIPTLSHQSKEAAKEINDRATQPESLNDKLRQGKTELVEVLIETPVKDLRKAIGINDRFLFINDLFRGDESMYERSIKTINSFNIYPEAEFWISRELKTKLGWSNEHPSVHLFDQLVKRRFS
ncbi:MAG TPA: hypothetical protein VN451_05250 [Chitinophagaceae bacterium]|nr:hypothetical protein [Chitinophagaceae bacterium]